MRYVGCIVIFCAFMWFAHEKTSQIRWQYAMKEKWYQKCLLLQGEIEYGQTPLPQAFAQIAGRGSHDFVEESIARLSRELTANIGKKPFYEVWTRWLEEFTAKLSLPKRELMQLGEQMGTLEKQTETANLQRYLVILERTLLEEKEALNDRVKVTRTVILTCGIFLVLILL